MSLDLASLDFRGRTSQESFQSPTTTSCYFVRMQSLISIALPLGQMREGEYLWIMPTRSRVLGCVVTFPDFCYNSLLSSFFLLPACQLLCQIGFKDILQIKFYTHIFRRPQNRTCPRIEIFGFTIFWLVGMRLRWWRRLPKRFLT
jgi:hypothetical protein